jgi:hypothetical protein
MLRFQPRGLQEALLPENRHKTHKMKDSIGIKFGIATFISTHVQHTLDKKTQF